MSKPADSTADVIQRLVEGGAHLLALTKLSSMLAREEPMDATDYLTAFNPRGDGYQSPAGSSSGSAVAVAAYRWIDCAIGTDTSGSGRRPAMVNGVWEFRPTHDRISRDGLVQTFGLFDTPCILARELEILERVAKILISPPEPSEPAVRPYRLIYPTDYLPVANKEQMKLIYAFVEDAKSTLAATFVSFSIRDSWKRSHPTGTPEDVDKYLLDVIQNTYYRQFFHSTDSFRESYAREHESPPYVIPFVQDRWDQGAKVTPDEYNEAMRRLRIYKDWLHEQLFGDNNLETFVLLPVANAEPNYRDKVSHSPRHQSALDQLFIPPILGAPDVVIPIGDVSYSSMITKRLELLPVVVNVVGAPDHDFLLLEAVKIILERSKRPTKVNTGARIF
ncbi:hypothetical protein FDECE_13483 [Fusarium decemcellulare]|nr:hypothetical protein FDECE_13483 [Fusarium decemcellulare]